jgi:hypothetical protein
MILKDLYEMKMQDTPAIYLFMQDAFPHRDLIEKLGLDASRLDILLRKYDFIEYNVYSLFCYTMPTMSSTINMKKEHIKGDWPDDEEMAYLRASLGGNNIITKILSDNGYRNYVSLNNNDGKYFFGESPTSEIIESHIKAGWSTLLHAIRCGSILLYLQKIVAPCGLGNGLVMLIMRIKYLLGEQAVLGMGQSLAMKNMKLKN